MMAGLIGAEAKRRTERYLCPTCGALPQEECRPIRGRQSPTYSHSARYQAHWDATALQALAASNQQQPPAEEQP